jgi:signal transduction histidine kinase
MDVAVPALVLAVGITELLSFSPPGLGWAIALETTACALLVWRRHRPILVCSLAAVANASLPFVGPRLEDVATPILIGVLISYSLARWVASLRGLAGLAVLLLAIAGDYLFADDRLHNISDLVFVSALLAPPYVFGRIARRLALTTELLREQQELVRRQAVREERDRIARELHDVIAHSLSAMVVQTAAAQDVVRSDPDRAEDALRKVADTGRRALAETGRLLHVVRDADDELGLEPTPGLAQVPALVQGFRQHGLDVRAVLGDSPDLPAAVDTSAYRLVQEALTNALRYAPDRVVELEVRTDGERLRIRSSNRADGHGAPKGQGAGLGLVGLAERVTLLGGELRHGLTPTGRFELDVDLPIGQTT